MCQICRYGNFRGGNNNAVTGKEGGIFMQFVHEALSRLTHAPFTPPPSINTHVDASNFQLFTNHKLINTSKTYNHINKMFGFEMNEHRRYSDLWKDNVHDHFPHEIKHAPKTAVSYERKSLVDRYEAIIKETRNAHHSPMKNHNR